MNIVNLLILYNYVQNALIQPNMFSRDMGPVKKKFSFHNLPKNFVPPLFPIKIVWLVLRPNV